MALRKILLVSLMTVLAIVSRTYGQEEKCLSCHKKLTDGAVVHPAIQMGCSSCHKAMHAGKKAVLTLVAELPALCFTCHDQGPFTKTTVHPPVAGGMCTSCHNPHSSPNPRMLLSQPPALCFTCHDQSPFSKASVHTPVAGGMCTSCHNPHSGPAPRMLPSQQPDLCFSCHDAQAFKGAVVHPPVAEGQCTTCHTPHSSDTSPNLVSPMAELCVMCHEAKPTHVLKGIGLNNNHPLAGKPDPARPGSEISCTSCHTPHAAGRKFLFKVDKGDICRICHMKTIVRP